MDRTVLIVTGESSGDLYGSLLARRLKMLYPGVEVYGVGGERMKREGVRLIGAITGAFGLVEALHHLSTLKKNLQGLRDAIDRLRPQIGVLIDFPEFNLRVAEMLRDRGIKVLYYVSPQIWAWRRGRWKKMKRLCDMVAVILPFEEEFYRQKGVRAEFVGHPVMEEIEVIKGGKGYQRESLGLKREVPLVALLPGSRRSELKRHLPLYQEVVEGLLNRLKSIQFVMPLAPGVDEEEFKGDMEVFEAMGVKVLKGRATEALSASNSAVVASGTATLQAALLGTPMVVVYKLSPLTYLIGRLLVNVKYISLVNLLLNRQVVKELIQWEATPERVMKEVLRTLNDDSLRQYMHRSFHEIRTLYEGKNASQRVAELVGECAGW